MNRRSFLKLSSLVAGGALLKTVPVLGEQFSALVPTAPSVMLSVPGGVLVPSFQKYVFSDSRPMVPVPAELADAQRTFYQEMLLKRALPWAPFMSVGPWASLSDPELPCLNDPLGQYGVLGRWEHHLGS